MDIRKMKVIIVFMIVIVSAILIGFFMFKSIEEPKLKLRIEDEVISSLGVMTVYVAAVDIMPKEIITEDMIMQVESMVILNSEDTPADSSEIVGKMARTKIYANEQFVFSRLENVSEERFLNKDGQLKDNDESKLRKITFDVPSYGFVNGEAQEGTYVDLMLDLGNGTFEEVLNNIYIYKITELEGGNWSKIQNEGEGLTAGQKLANTATTDRRVTIISTEKDREKIFEKCKYGKFYFQLHLYEDFDVNDLTKVTE